MALKPTKSVTFDNLASDYGVVNFQDALANFLACINNPGVSTYTICQQAEDMLIPFCAVPVFHVIKFTKRRHSGESEISDSVHAWPEVVDLYTRTTPAWFNTVIVHQDSPQDQGNKGTSNDLGPVWIESYL